ncbi:MAG: hypothetical protein WDM96_04190 [Lacunisphaera sp.]
MTAPNPRPTLGALALRFYYQPVGRLRDCLREGGPIQQRRTEHGRQEMERAAYTLPPLAPLPGYLLEVHLLTGRRFWYQTAFCLWTFARQSERPLAPVIYDDGTLAAEYRAPLHRLFPDARFVAQAETIARLDAHLPPPVFPSCASAGATTRTFASSPIFTWAKAAGNSCWIPTCCFSTARPCSSTGSTARRARCTPWTAKPRMVIRAR